MDMLLKILEENARIPLEDLAAMTNDTVENTAKRIDEYCASGVIHGFRTLVDYEKAEIEMVQAMIEVCVKPKKGYGFDEIAMQIADLEEVKSLMLMSGGYDLCVMMVGKSFKDIAVFVAKRLSSIDDVMSTATHFILKTYKKDGVIYEGEEVDERGMTTL